MDKKRILLLILGLIFFSFAVVQYNDVDGWIWILIYSVPAVLFIAQAFGKFHPSITRIVIYLSMMGLLLYIPDLRVWIRDGCPSIIEGMKAESQYIEFVRESLGLLLIAICLYFFSLRK